MNKIHYRFVKQDIPVNHQSLKIIKKEFETKLNAKLSTVFSLLNAKHFYSYTEGLKENSKHFIPFPILTMII